MRRAVLSDVHANREALTAVLADVRRRGIRELFFLGDAVGYGPDPVSCFRTVVAECRVLVAGNHDWGVVGKADVSRFNESARAAIAWTQERMERTDLDGIRRLALTAVVPDCDSVLVHATPFEPDRWHYLLTLGDAEQAFSSFSGRLCFVGHSHVPFVLERAVSGETAVRRHEVAITVDRRYIVNAGSVGQPRDHDPRACYVVMDEDRLEIVRVSYDIGETQRKMAAAGLPEPLISRLSLGL